MVKLKIKIFPPNYPRAISILVPLSVLHGQGPGFLINTPAGQQLPGAAAGRCPLFALTKASRVGSATPVG